MNSGILYTLGFLLASSELIAGTVEYTSARPEDLRLEVAESIQPLPFQTVRLRAMLRNTSGEDLGPVCPIEEASVLTLTGGPGRRPYPRLQPRLYVRDIVGDAIVGLNVSRKAFTVPINLADKESIQTSKTLALVSNEDEQYMRFPPDHSLFVDGGEYTVTISYGRHDEPKRTARITIHVREPRGDDAKICEQLSADEKLAVVMASPVHMPDEDQLPLLIELVERFPNSSYADYARFAIARWHMMGVGWVMENREGGRKDVLKALRDVRQFRYLPREKQFEGIVRNFSFYHVHGRDKLLTAIVNRILDAGDHDLPARRKAILELVDFYTVSPEERAAAVAEMELITNPDFPYRPNVLIAMRAALGDTDPQRTAEIEEELNERFPDAIEWLEVMAGTMTDAEWTAFRKRVPAEAGPAVRQPAAE